MNTKTECFYPLFGCLDEFEKNTGNSEWNPQNDKQYVGKTGARFQAFIKLTGFRKGV